MRLGADTRVALYYAPAEHDPLWIAGAAWLGRDSATGAAVPQPKVDGIAEITADPRLYGFHATLKPPMRLRDGVVWDQVLEAAALVAAGTSPFGLPNLSVREVHGFIALRETTPSPPLQAVSDLAVAALDHLRAPPETSELERRRQHGLSPAEEVMLQRWGYPYVFGTWFFHMTVSRRLYATELAHWSGLVEAHFAPALSVGRVVDSLCIFVQSAPGAPFLLRHRIPLGG